MQLLKKIVTNGLIAFGLSFGLMVSALAVIAVEPPSYEEWLATAQLDFSELDAGTLRIYADANNAVAQFYLGKLYSDGKGVRQDYAKAAELYLKAANQGLAIAQNFISSMYDSGQGVKQDAAQAYQWQLKSANQGFAPAQDELGNNYSSGKGVRQDYDEAEKWLQKSCESGLHEACKAY